LTEVIRPNGILPNRALLPNVGPGVSFTVNSLLGTHRNPAAGKPIVNNAVSDAFNIINDLTVVVTIVKLEIINFAKLGWNPTTGNPSHHVLSAQSFGRSLINPRDPGLIGSMPIMCMSSKGNILSCPVLHNHPDFILEKIVTDELHPLSEGIGTVRVS
jgi:hypothetical protein